MPLRAVIAGATGLIGSNLADHLVSKGREVYGIARKPQGGVRGVRPIAADLLEPESLRSSLAGVDPTHVFLTTWVRRATEGENIAANGALVRNVLASGPRQAGVGLAHRPGPGARDRGRDRHDQAPPGRVPRIPADARLVPAL